MQKFVEVRQPTASSHPKNIQRGLVVLYTLIYDLKMLTAPFNGFVVEFCLPKSYSSLSFCIAFTKYWG